MTYALAIFLALQDPPDLNTAGRFFAKFSTSDDPLERADAVRALGEAADEKHDKKTAELLIQLLATELSRGGHGKGDWAASGWVIMNVIDSISGRPADKDRSWAARPGLRDPAAIAWLVDDVIKKKSRPTRVRFYAAIAAGRLTGENVSTALSELAAEPPPLQIAALEALARRKDKSTTAAVVKTFEAADAWEAKSAALHALSEIKDDACADALIKYLADIEKKVRDGGDPDLVGRLLDDTVATLRTVTGLDGGFIPGLWAQLWEAKKKGTKASGLDDPNTAVRPTEFYGIQSHSSRIIFLIDTSGSMEAKASDKEKNIAVATGGKDEYIPGGPLEKMTPKEQGCYKKCKELLERLRRMTVDTRIEGVKRELSRCLFSLEPRVQFNVIAWSDAPRPWREDLVPATWENKFAAMQAVQGQPALGGTNYFDTLRSGFEFIDRAKKGAHIVQDKRVNYAEALNGVDTFYLLSDGEPTAGDLINKDLVAGELMKTNLLRRTTVHAICIGDADANNPQLAIDPKFLKRLADENGGQFKHVTGK